MLYLSVSPVRRIKCLSPPQKQDLHDRDVPGVQNLFLQATGVDEGGVAVPLSFLRLDPKSRKNLRS